jgi:hypothetical protein
MSRYILFVLLLTTAVALAQDKPKSQPAVSDTVADKETEAAQGRKEHAQAKMPKTEDAQGKAEEPQQKREEAQGQTQEAQPKSEEAQGQTGEAQPATDEGAKLTSVPGGKALGMSILGNQDAPKALVIVPWKSSELGDSPGNSPMLDDSRQPVDKEVFMRALRYYEIRSGTKQ